MCGIVGAISQGNANDVVLEGLKRLEYRGYDSCGICNLPNDNFKIYKSINRVGDLQKQIDLNVPISIGHTRWATHGKVNVDNAHPHISSDQQMVMIHNGVIENFEQLKHDYCQDIKLYSQTDTLVILEVLNHFYKQSMDMKTAIKKFIEVVEGSYSCIVWNISEKDKLYAIRNKTPLLIGKKPGLVTISSDAIAVVDDEMKFCPISNKQFAIIDNENVKLFNKDLISQPVVLKKVQVEFNEVMLEHYDTYLEKEINEQPKALRNLIENYENHTWDPQLLSTIKDASKIYIIASGTSLNSGFATKRIIEDKLKIPVECAIGSEFGYDNNLIPKKSIFIFLSQSGETADSLLVLHQVEGIYKTIAITNSQGSQIDMLCDFSLNLYAGVETSVASTKAYTAQIALIMILISECIEDKNIYKRLSKVCKAQEQILKDKDVIKNLATTVAKYKDILYLGRLKDYALGQEASLKVKEITYINVNAISSGELKHGTISLIDDDMLSIFIITDETIKKQTRSNVQEVKARGGKVLIFSTTNTADEGDDYVIDLFDVGKEEQILLSIIPHQLLALYSAKKLGLDIDMPRNLAKSVTVE